MKEPKDTKIVYMGTPDFAEAPLQALYDAGYSIPLVITRPDQQRDRGKKLQPTPVKALAESLGIPVVSPETLRLYEADADGNRKPVPGKADPEILKTLRTIAPDVIVVAAYGQILPVEILELPPYGCINVHASLLPRWRGAAPVQRAIEAGDEMTGVTIMYMGEALDKGDMLSTFRTPTAGKNAGTLTDELSHEGAELLIDTLPDLLNGTAQPVPQDESQATYAHMVFKKDGLIDFSKTADEIAWKVLAMTPWPSAFAYYHGEPMKILAADPAEIYKGNAQEGTILEAADNGILVVCGGRTTLRITEMQMPGKKPVRVSDYLRGNTIEIGAMLSRNE